MSGRPMAPTPSPGVAGVQSYSVPRPACPIDLFLDGNEGATPPEALLSALVGKGTDVLRRYPDTRPLERRLAGRLGVAPERVVVTAGADDALDRLCRAVLAPGRELVLPVPTFEMLARYARITGADIRTVLWEGARYPLDAVLGAVSPRTALIAVVSPNNPTGAVATLDEVRRLSEAAPHAVVLLDHAYVEFADADLTEQALLLPNVVVTRTLSKAWGVAGLRVGVAAGPADVIGWMRAAGAPYAVAGPSLALAEARLDGGDADVVAFVERIRSERGQLEALLRDLGASVVPSQANFLLARLPDASWVRDALAGLGIAVRIFPGRRELAGALRITCPGNGDGLRRLSDGLAAALRPEALLLDMDGVLADVSSSYREAIIRTAASFGVSLTGEDVAAGKAEGDANNDWELTRRLLAARGVDAELGEVTRRFERLYQGADGVPGLRETERLTVPVELLERLAARLPLGVVTGRPRGDAIRFLRAAGIDHTVSTVVCMEDGPRKPDPAPVRRALAALDAERGWLVGDTPDDVRAARAAGVVPLGIVAPGEDAVAATATLTASGAGRVLGSLFDLLEILP